MGNATSTAASNALSDPKALQSHEDHTRSTLNRRATVGTANSSRDSHHRRRSAPVNGHDAPPPTYSAAIADRHAVVIDISGTSNEPSGSRATAQNMQRAISEPQSVGRSRSTRTAARPLEGIPEVVQAGRSSTSTERPRRPVRRNTTEDALDTLKKYDTVIIVDDSGSMQGDRWEEAREALASLAEIASRYDADGIDITFLNDKRVGQNMRDSGKIRELFDKVRPQGYTPIGEKLENLLLFYMDNMEAIKERIKRGERKVHVVRPINYIVITDGEPTDDPEDVIVAAARRLDDNHAPLTQVGIQFVQIGSDSRATDYLKQLDDSLQTKHKVRDMVDTTPYEGGTLSAETLIKILIGGINRRVDRRGGISVMD